MPSRNLARLNNQIYRELRAIEDPITRQIMIEYKRALDEIRVQLTKLYDKYAKEGVLTLAEMSKYNRLKSMHDQIADTMGTTFSKSGKLIDQMQEVQYRESFYRNAWAINQNAGVEFSWGLLNNKTIKAAVENPLTLIAKKDLTQNGLIVIRRAVTQGLIQGQSYHKMAQEVKKALERSAKRAITIAQTEAHRCAVKGQIDLIEDAEGMGIELKRYWDATLDNRTRPEHGAMDGKAADEDGLFHTEWGLTPGPGQAGPPEMNINCRCSVTARVDDIPPKYRRIRDEGVVPYKTYEQWAEERNIR